MSKEQESFNRISKAMDYADDMVTSYYEVGDFEIVENGLKRLEAIDNSSPSEALECLDRIDNTLCLNNIKGKLEFGIDAEEHTDCDSVIGMTEDLESIKATLLKAEQDKKKLNEIEKLTYLLYSERRKIGQEYVKWCKENNILFNDETNMITWVLAIKLKEWLK